MQASGCDGTICSSKAKSTSSTSHDSSACLAGDHIAVLPKQHHMAAHIEVLGAHLGLVATDQTGSVAIGDATLDTPFDLELLDNVPASCLEGLDFEYAITELARKYGRAIMLSFFCWGLDNSKQVAAVSRQQALDCEPAPILCRTF